LNLGASALRLLTTENDRTDGYFAAQIRLIGQIIANSIKIAQILAVGSNCASRLVTGVTACRTTLNEYIELPGRKRALASRTHFGVGDS
jgi:hypothetical protein